MTTGTPAVSPANSRPLRVAIFLEQEIHIGGGFQQALRTIQLLLSMAGADLQFITITTVKANLPRLASLGIPAEYWNPSELRRLCWLARRHVFWAALTARLRIRNGFDQFLRARGVDLLYFTGPSGFSMMTDAIPFVITVWDLCHRDWPEFPEVREGGQFESREYVYTRALVKATAVMVDSALGRDNVVRRYGVDARRVQVLPFSPAVAIAQAAVPTNAIRDKYGIHGDYVFYPAQFWAHKNHAYIVYALALLKQQGTVITAVFPGSDKGNRAFITALAQSCGVAEQIRCVGFVPDEDMADLYRGALALVMPTYFGPTNLPPLEAFSLGVPVLYPDLPGLREQVGDAALLLDLNEPATLAVQLTRLLAEPALRAELVRQGQQQLATCSDADRQQVLRGVFAQFRSLRSCWS